MEYPDTFSVICRASDLISPILQEKLGLGEMQGRKKHSFMKDHKPFSKNRPNDKNAI